MEHLTLDQIVKAGAKAGLPPSKLFKALLHLHHDHPEVAANRVRDSL